MSKATRNTAASVRTRLLNLARSRGEDYGLILGYYAIERLLYRLSVSSFADRFVLKGAMLFTVWHIAEHRPTRDLDLLGYGSVTPEDLVSCFRSICTQDSTTDGVTFDPVSVKAHYIREQSEYGGTRIKLLCDIAGAKVSVQIDVGVGDAITPEAESTDFPLLLDGFPAPRLKIYPVYTVVAEKLEAMIKLGMTNSRMKDFFDLMTLAKHTDLDNQILEQAINATFNRRGTALPKAKPVACTPEFFADAAKNTQWNAFLKKNSLAENRPPELGKAIAVIWDRFGSILLDQS